MSLDDETLRAWIAAADPRRPWPGIDAANDARLEELACAAPALAAEVMRLRAERDAARETARALGASLAATRADFHAMEQAYYGAQAEVLRLRGLISEQCAAIETGPTRRRIPGCQTVGPCHVCDYPQTATAPGPRVGGGGGETDGGDVQTPRE